MDHCDKERRKVNPRERANIFSLITFSYLVGLFKKAFKRDLKEEDLYEVLTKCNSKRCGNKLEEQWIVETEKNEQPSVVRMLWRRYGWRYVWMCFVHAVVQIFRTVLEPYAITNLIAYFQPGQTTLTKTDGYHYGALLIFARLSFRFFIHNYILWVQQLGLEVKTSFSSLLYRKALRITPTFLSKITLGNIVTLVTKDVHTFKDAIWILSDVSYAVIQVCIVSYLIFAKIGSTSFIGIGVLFLSIPVQVLIGKWINKLRLETGEKTDERLQVTQETLSTIRIIKMYAWESFFQDKINAARRKEVNKMLRGFYLRTVLVLIGVLTSNLGFYILIIAYIWMGFSSDTTIVFYLLSNFHALRETLGVKIPYNIGKVAELMSAGTRVNRLIKADELHPHYFDYIPAYKPLVEMKEAKVHIGNKEILNIISLTADTGLTIVTGSVGSGKSSLLKTILQDYPLTSGNIISYGRISYASQDPWLFPSSIKQNILFGEQFNEKRYLDVIRVCALQYDFDLLEKADETIVSDRGMNLSKGQQARINLARAIYKESEIYLLDDSLTALDAHVKDYIFEECIKNYLKDKICILVSQTANHIDEADNVIIMDRGQIVDSGKPNEKIIQEVREMVLEDDDLENDVIEDEEDTEKDEESKLLETEQTTVGKNIYREVKKEGKVNLVVYHKYIVFGGGLIMVLVNLVLVITTQTTQSLADKLLTKWVDEKQKVLTLQEEIQFPSVTTNIFDLNHTVSKAEATENKTFRMYSVFLLSNTILALMMTYAIFDFCRRASIKLHTALVGSVVNSVMSFFDSHFIGNVLNRFSEDLAQIDEHLPFILKECLGVLFATIGHIGLVLTVDTRFIIYISIVCFLLLVIRTIYIPTGRSLKRLEASSRSPMIGHLNATLDGLTTIRAYKAERILIDEFDRHQDLYTSAYYTSICSLRGFNFFMDCIGSTLLISVVINFLFFDTGASAGNVGLALTQVTSLGNSIQWGLRQWSEMENNMTSVERVLEYAGIPSEKKGGEVLDNWPTDGTVEYENVCLAYNNEKILKNLTFEVEPKQRIGIVGRTGAGKSSLISSIFRLYDVQGKILIDGVDIRRLSLKFLRKKLAIIPQDPVLFSGTARTNLDPFREFEDEELWSVLEKVDLKNSISNLDNVIGSVSNFSCGQKQLFCLARALLRKSKILILDEATANMDHETDARLHKTISQHFTDCTVFIIAHRLHSILECDKVMVLDKGVLIEFDDPLSLLENENGIFHKMVKQAGLLNYLS
nr:probable multidrug resistance-associated protein lethal(2)03659 [Leptinotarsa decemlineata]